jgi:hypothetical protein
MKERPWTQRWLRDNKAQLIMEAEHPAHYTKMVSVYLVPGTGLIMRYRVQGGDGILDMDELFIPAGGKVNSIVAAETDLANYVGASKAIAALQQGWDDALDGR